MTMKRQSILRAVTALGIISGSIASVTLMGTNAALADDWPDSNDRPAWSQRCDRNWDNAYCNPKVNSNHNQDWSDPDQNQNQDSLHRYEWRNRNQGSWNGNRDQWENRDQDPLSQDQWDNRNPDQWQTQKRAFGARLSSGKSIPAYPERSGRRIVLRRYERYPLTLVVSQDVSQMYRGRAVLPRNSRIEGELVPVRDGYRFEADRVRFPNGRQERIWAVSNTFGTNDTYDRNDRNEAQVSSGAAGILSAILGRSTSSNSTVIGDVFDRYPNSRRDLVVIYPQRSLDLRLTRDFVMDWRNF
jgi:hypothetical protein